MSDSEGQEKSHAVMKVLAGLKLLNVIALVLAGIGLIGAASVLGSLMLFEHIQQILVAAGILVLLVAILPAYFAYSLLKEKKWAFWLEFFIRSVTAFLALVVLLVLQSTLALIPLLINTILLFFMFRIREDF